MNNWFEAMESRVLFSGGLTTSGSAFPIVTLPANTDYTAGEIGSGDIIVAYQKNQALMAKIVDTSGNTIVQEFKISTNGQSVPTYTPLATVKDANGDAAIVYGILGTHSLVNLYLVRVSPTGTTVDAPTLIPASGTEDDANPAIALGSDNSVMVTWLDLGDFSGNGTIAARGFDSSDAPLFAETQLSPSTTAAHETLKAPAIVYNASASNFLVAWGLQDYDSSYVGTLGALEDRTISPTGVLGTDPTVYSTAQGGNSNNTVQQPVLTSSGIGTTVEQFGSSGAGYPFSGSMVPWTSFNADGSVRQAPTNVFTTMSPNEVITFGADESDNSHTTLLMKAGTYDGSQFQQASVSTVTVNNDDGSVAAENDGLLPGFLGDLVNIPIFGFIFATPVTPGDASSDITVSGQATTYSAPAATPPVISVTGGSEADSKHMVFLVSLNRATDHDVTVHYKTVAGSAVAGTNYQAVDDAVATIPQGSTSAQVVIGLTNPPISDASFDLVISQPSGATLGSPTDGPATIREEDVAPFLLCQFMGGGAQIPSSLPGDKVKSTEKVTLTNSSNSTVKETVTTQLFLAPDATDTSTWIPFAPKSVTTKLNLKAGKSTTVTLKPGSIPPNTPPGTYSVVSKTTEANGATSTATSSNTVTVAAQSPDLAGSFSGVPVSIKKGMSGRAKLTVMEVGNVPFSGTLKIDLNISPDGNLNDATELGFLQFKLNLKPGTSKTNTAKFQLPATLDNGSPLPDGNYSLIAVLDPDQNYPDVNRANNVVVSTTSISVNS